MTLDPDGFPFDPDPLHVVDDVDEDLDPRVPSYDDWLERQYANDLDPATSGMVIVYGCAAILAVLVALAILWLAGWQRG